MKDNDTESEDEKPIEEIKKNFDDIFSKPVVPKSKNLEKKMKTVHKFDKTKFDFMAKQVEAQRELPLDIREVSKCKPTELEMSYRDNAKGIPSQENANYAAKMRIGKEARKEAVYSYVKVEAVREIDSYESFIYESKEMLMTLEDLQAFNKDDDLEMLGVSQVYPTTGLGVVVYLDKEEYSEDFDENTEIHFPFDKESMLRLLFHIITQTYDIKEIDLENIYVGHEHGGKKNKCHYQCCIFFKKQIKRNWHPAIFKYKKAKCLIMYQKSKRPHALRNYVKKDKDFCFLNHDEKIFPVAQKQDKKGNWQIDMARTLQINLGRDPEALKHYLFQRNPTWFIANSYGINKTIDMLGQEYLPDFRWLIPEYLRRSSNPKHQAIVYHIDEWFVPENTGTSNLRRKSLILYGKQNVGKTRFAQGLVPHPSYYMYVRSGFAPNSLKTAKTAKLIILDDLEQFQNKIEQYKAMLSGEPTQVREAFINCDIPGLPCIMITNNNFIASFIYNHPLLQRRCTLVQLESEDYLGPPGSRIEAFDEIKHYVNADFIEMANIKKMEFQQKQEKFKDESLLNKKTSRQPGIEDIKSLIKEEVEFKLTELKDELFQKDAYIKTLEERLLLESQERIKWEKQLEESYKRKVLEFKKSIDK